jgi:hypothetical protein
MAQPQSARFAGRTYLAQPLVVPMALAALDIVIAIVGLAVGTANVNRRVEWMFFAGAGVLAFLSIAISLFYVWTQVTPGQAAAKARWPLALALVGLALSLVVAVVRPNVDQERADRAASQQTVILSTTDKADLTKIANNLRNNGHPGLAAAVSGLAAAGGALTGGLISQELATLRDGGKLGVEAAGAIAGILARAGGAKLSFSPTLTIDHPTLSLGGLHYTAAGKPPAAAHFTINRPKLSLDLSSAAATPAPHSAITLNRPLFSLATLRLRVLHTKVSIHSQKTLPYTP